jgi:hypothetical protein
MLRDHNSGTNLYSILLKSPLLKVNYQSSVSSGESLNFAAFVAWYSQYLDGGQTCTWLCDNYNSYLTKAVENGVCNEYLIRYGAGGILQSDVPLDIVFSNGSYITWDAYQNGSRLRYYTSTGTLVYTFQKGPYAQFPPFIPPMPLYDINQGDFDVYARGLDTGSVTNNMGVSTLVKGSSLFFWMNGITPVDLDDPYLNIPDSTPSGPAEGTGIPTGDPVDIPGLPTLSVTDTGFVTLFNPTMSQVKNLADYMWNGLFDVNNFKKLFADPMDCILGFNMVPVAVPSGAAANINIGNLVTSVTMNVATSQWIELDCGTIDIGLPYGSYLDFSPYTKFSIYLPYIGTCELSADDVAGKALTLKYHVDALSCSCVAYLKCGDHVLYQWTGSCGYSIPVTQNDFSRMIMGMISLAAAGIGGGAAVTGAGLMQAGAAVAKNVSMLKPEVHRSGSIGSSAGLMGGQTPYLIIEIPQACKPEKQYHYTGYPGFITVTVGDLTGYAEFEEIILDGIGCTEEERSIIESLCKGGIYV